MPRAVSKSKSNPASSEADVAAPRKKPSGGRKDSKAPPAAAATQRKEKRISGSFSIPISDYTLIAELKSRSKTAGRPVKKNELLRAGLQSLEAMSNDALQSALQRLVPSTAKAAKKSKK